MVYEIPTVGCVCGGGGVNHSLPAAYVAFNDVITFSDANLNDNVRDVH